MPKVVLVAILLAVIIIPSYIIYTQGSKSAPYKFGNWAEGDSAINQARHAYDLKKSLGEDLSTGPCLSNDLIPGWVADLVHSPRQPIDDLPENQCNALLEGRATHYVELDLEGNLVGIK